MFLVIANFGQTMMVNLLSIFAIKLTSELNLYLAAAIMNMDNIYKQIDNALVKVNKNFFLQKVINLEISHDQLTGKLKFKLHIRYRK